MNKVKIYYLTHTDNMEGKKSDFLESKIINYIDLQSEIDDMKADSDGETCYTFLYCVELFTNRILHKGEQE